MTAQSLPTRTLRDQPDLDQLKRQAKELLEAFRNGDSAAIAEVDAHYHSADPRTFALHDAQLVLARAHGFESWPRLKAFVDGVTIRRLDEAIRANDVPTVRDLLRARPELATFDIDNHSILHCAVLNRNTDIVRLLMQHGANARFGFYPHGDATHPLALAIARGDHEIVEIIDQEESRRRASEDQGAVRGMTPLHMAAFSLDEAEIAVLLDRGANPDSPGRDGLTPLDAAATAFSRQRLNFRERFSGVTARLQRAGARMTARAAVALGDTEWVRTSHAKGMLPGPLDGVGGLLRVAVTHDQPGMLKLLLDLELDPDERVRVPGVDEVEYTWGFPLWECAATGKHAMAEILLEHGADPNAIVFASGSPVSQAYGQGDARMIALLEQYGGAGDVGLAASYRMTELARKMFAGEADQRKSAEQLLDAAACGGDPELVRLALEYIEWSREDPRWFLVLEQPLRLWNHGPGHWYHPEWDRTTYLECFRLLLERCDPNLRGRQTDSGQFGLTILHSIAGSRGHVTADDRLAFATLLLDAGARLDLRDNVLQSTPLGWACRWGRLELVRLFLERGADPVEPDAEPWASPIAWAKNTKHEAVLAVLRAHPRMAPE